MTAPITKENKMIINQIVDDFNLGIVELENLTFDLITYIKMCKKENKIIKFEITIKEKKE